MRLAALIGKKFVGDPHQTQATHQHQPWNLEQPDNPQGHQGAHADGAHRAPNNGLLLQIWGQVARRQGDHDGVVACQHQVDQNNSQQR